MKSRSAGSALRVVVLAAVLSTAFMVPPPQAALSADSLSGALSPSGHLFGASAESSTDAWAVGTYDTPRSQTLILHWDGTAWSKVKSPNPGWSDNVLYGVSALSATDAWAVGYYDSYTAARSVLRTLVLHWDGTAWSEVASPKHGTELNAVSAVSTTDAWAVGDGPAKSGSPRTLILHWDGTAWSRVKSPSPGGYDILHAVSAVSATDAWAVGTSQGDTLVLHWDGTAWSRVQSPQLGSVYNWLTGVSATSPTDAWAVGFYTGATGDRALLLHWDGTAWSRVGSQNPRWNYLEGVSAVSATDAWAVGVNGKTSRTVILHWDGTTWSRVTNPG
jgi:hypothetical protein